MPDRDRKKNHFVPNAFLRRFPFRGEYLNFIQRERKWQFTLHGFDYCEYLEQDMRQNHNKKIENLIEFSMIGSERKVVKGIGATPNVGRALFELFCIKHSQKKDSCVKLNESQLS